MIYYARYSSLSSEKVQSLVAYSLFKHLQVFQVFLDAFTETLFTINATHHPI